MLGVSKEISDDNFGTGKVIQDLVPELLQTPHQVHSSYSDKILFPLCSSSEIQAILRDDALDNGQLALYFLSKSKLPDGL